MRPSERRDPLFVTQTGILAGASSSMAHNPPSQLAVTLAYRTKIIFVGIKKMFILIPLVYRKNRD